MYLMICYGQQRLTSDCANAPSDVSLRWPLKAIIHLKLTIRAKGNIPDLFGRLHRLLIIFVDGT